MAKIILINPPAQSKSGSPLLSQMYLVSSLLTHGHEVKIFDLGAQFFKYNLESINREILSYQPDIIGVTIYTFNALSTYDFIAQFNSRRPEINCLFLAGGPHPTAVPDEPLKFGFDVTVRGEGEDTLVELAQYCNDINQFKKVKGISYKTSSRKIQYTPAKPFKKNLDTIPRAVDSLHLFNPKWYLKNGTYQNIPAGMLTSRGCPGKCIFCANYVTGRQFRYRSVENVLDEMRYYNERYGTTFFSFWDDCFTSNSKHLMDLCERFINFKNAEAMEFQWSCNSRADRLSRTLLQKMKTAGCISMTIGIESGSPETLHKIQKNIDLDKVEKLLRCCKDLELRTQANFMVGFPWETKKHLQDTLDYMKRINNYVDGFSTRGVVIPFPGTELYEKYKDSYSFENWWFNQDVVKNYGIGQQEQPRIMGEEIDKKIYLEDPILDMNFFNYSKNVKRMIKRCLEYKGEETLKKLEF